VQLLSFVFGEFDYVLLHGGSSSEGLIFRIKPPTSDIKSLLTED
jgi:hypothetical protein